MAEISINWGTKVIFVPKDYMQLTQEFPTEIRQLDINDFRLDLKDLEDSVAGMPMLDTHVHVSPITVGGVQLARVVEIINNYTVTFEDGQYAVNLVGANSNIGDRVNVNQVSVRSANSAGLTFSDVVNDQSFLGGRIFIDPDRGFSGISFPQGTPSYPVDNYSDADFIAKQKRFFKFQLEGHLTLTIDDDINDTDWFGNDIVQSSIILAGTPTNDCVFNDMEISGAFDGRTVLNNCRTSNIINFSGVMRNCEFSDFLQISANTTERITFTNCQSSVPGTGTPIIDWNGANCDGEIRKYAGGFRLKNFNNPGRAISFDLISGHVVIDESCTEGTIVVRGGAKLTNFAENNANLIIDTSGLILPESGYGGILEYKENSIYTGKIYPYGSLQFPVNNWTDIEALSIRYKLNEFIIKGYLNLNESNNISSAIITGTSVSESIINLSNSNTLNTVFDKIAISGYLNGSCTINRCIVNDIYGFSGIIRKSRISGNIVLDSNAGANINLISFENTISSTLGNTVPVIDWNGANCDGDCSGHYGGFRLKNFNKPNNIFTFDIASGLIVLDESCTEGTVIIRGTASILNKTLNGSNLIIDTSGLIYPESSYRGQIIYNENSVKSGNRYPYGTSQFPVNSYDDMEELSNFYNIKDFGIGGTLNMTGGSNISSHVNEIYVGTRAVASSILNIESTEDFSATGFDSLTLTGNIIAETESLAAKDCILHNVYGYWGDLQNSSIKGILKIGGPSLFLKNILLINNPILDLANVCINVNGTLNGGSVTIKNAPANAIIELALSGNKIIIDSSNHPNAKFNFDGIGSIVNDFNLNVDTEHLTYPPSAYQGKLYYNSDSNNTGNIFPYGTSTIQVNNINDLLQLSDKYSINNFEVFGILNIPSNTNIDSSVFIGTETIISNIVLNDSSMINTIFDNFTISGTANGSITIKNSKVNNLYNFQGVIKNSELSSTIVMDANSTRTSHAFEYTRSSEGVPVIDWNGIAADGSVRGHLGSISLKNFNKSDNIFEFDVPSGHIILDESCTGGTIVVRGAGRFTNNTLSNSNVKVDTSGFIFPEAAYIGAVHYSVDSPYAGNTYPIGTPLFAVNNHSDMHTIGIKYNLTTYKTSGLHLIPSNHNHRNETFIGQNSVINDVLVFNYNNGNTSPDFSGAGLQRITITGKLYADSPITVQDSILSNMSGIYGVVVDSAVSGNLVIGGPFMDFKNVSFASTPNIDMNYQCYAFRGVIDGGDARIKNIPTGGIVDLTVQGSNIIIDNSANVGSSIIISGYGNITNESNVEINVSDLLSINELKLIPNAVWNTDNSNATANTYGASISSIQNNTANLANLNVNVDNSDIANAVWSTNISTYNSGTAGASLQSASSGNVDYESMATSVWGTDPYSITGDNTVASMMINTSDRTIRILGLSQENFRYIDQIYDNSGRLLSGNIVIYTSASDLETNSNVTAQYNVTSLYDVEGNLVDYSVKRFL